MEKDEDMIPLSQSSVSMRLIDIQERCSRFMESSADIDELSLVEPSTNTDRNDPYDRG